MIVVDTNLIAYFFIRGEYSDLAEKAFQKDSLWVAPILWRSEFRSVLVKCIQDEFIKLEDAIQIMGEAEAVMRGREYTLNSADVLKLAALSGCSAYDIEFVVLAREIDIPLVTMDSEILKKFPEIARRLDYFVNA